MEFPLRAAIDLLQRDPARAEAMARGRLAAAPGDADALTVLGAALRRRGALAEARAVLAPLAESASAPWAALFEWAQVRVALGESRQAMAPLARTVALNPGLGAAWRLLGDLRLIAGDPGGAQAAYDRMLAAVVPDPRLRAPAEALAEGRLDEAIQALRPLLERQPTLAPAAHLLGETLARQGQLQPAEALLAHCAATAPGLLLARQSYALLLQRLGRPQAALAELAAVLARDGANARCRMARAAVLTEIGDYAAAAEVTAALLADFPDQPNGWLLHGAGLRTLGRTDEAVAAWRRCLALDAGCAEAWWSLANLKDLPLGDADREAMAAQLASGEAGDEARSLLHFSLGKSLEDASRDAAAFEHYAQGNRIQHRLRRYDPAATAAVVRQAQATLTPAFFADRAGWGAPAPDPIFVVGLPRSGSTLVEQILASHPEVEGVGERMDIQQMADWAAARGPLADLPREAVRQLGLDYLERTGARRRLNRPRFIDKAPWNFLHVGLIRLILPNAKIIDVRRHPLGCGFSVFRQHFAGGFDFAWDLADIGRYYADYVALMAHLDAALPGLVHRVIYEDLVADTEGEVRRLLDYLALPFDPATLRFFENRRPVATPSSEQVRRPIFGEGVDHWRRFEPWLGRLKAALGPALDAYPDPPPQSGS